MNGKGHVITPLEPAPAREKADQPNPQALAELQDRFLLWLARRELKRRAEEIKQKQRAHWIQA